MMPPISLINLAPPISTKIEMHASQHATSPWFGEGRRGSSLGDGAPKKLGFPKKEKVPLTTKYYILPMINTSTYLCSTPGARAASRKQEGRNI